METKYHLPLNMKSLKISVVILSVLAVTACKPSGSAQGEQSNNLAEGLSVCKPGGTSVGAASIQGTESLVSGQNALLSLDSAVDCNQASQATWKASGVTLGQGSQISANIKGSGIYVIEVSSAAKTLNENSGAQGKVIDTKVASTSVRVAVTNSAPLLVGPQVGNEFSAYDFSIITPSTTQLKSAIWNFGDGSPGAQSLTKISHSFSVGEYTIVVNATTTDNKSIVLNHHIRILPFNSGIDCHVENLDIAGPTEVSLESRTKYALTETPCLTYAGTQISWNFGDGTAPSTTTSVEHIYANPGNYTITAIVRLGSSDANTLTLTHPVSAVNYLEEMPGPVTPPVPVSVPADPLACSDSGQTRTTLEATTHSQSIQCGLNGSRLDTHREQLVETCQLNGESKQWAITSRTQVLVNEGACLNQSCQVPTSTGLQIIKSGQSIILFTSANPIGSCLPVQATIQCNNGVTTGNSAATQTLCNSGCGEFGAHGTTQIGVVTGSSFNPVTCPFGEQGIMDTTQQLSDKSCVNGNIITLNTRQGAVLSAGVCPKYSNIASERWTTCSSSCGGTESRIYECRNDQGALAPAERCAASPSESRLCDKNPEVVRSIKTTSANEEVGSSALCPKNQIGIITKTRSVNTTITTACINHRIQEESRISTPTDWSTNSYCRDLVTARCSHDSLSNERANGRYEWMVKCQNQIPLIKEFLTNFKDTDYQHISLNNSTRHLYPTFLEAQNSAAWIAPTSPEESCAIPETAYIAAVCVSSCATPDQTILAQGKQDLNLKPVPFIEALTKNLAWVGTLQSNSTMSSKELQKTAVDKWVTELVDTTQSVLIFKMKSGGEVTLTLNHAVLHESGRMKQAKEFKVGDNLLQLGGKLDTIASITEAKHFGKVYNLFVKSNDLKKNVVVINGYMAGTAFYQNEGTQELNRDLFKKRLLRGAIEK